jgi:deazaflavin-dependent oxidoreductase (nitroreductase family)
MDQKLYDPLVKTALAVITRTHRLLYRISDGRLSGRRFPGGGYVVWLTVTGRKSGQPRRVPLMGVPDGDPSTAPWVIAGSNGGQATAPAWVHNARANPDGHAEVNGERFPVRIEEITDPDERARLYARLNSSWSWFDSYQRRVSRQIPVFLLHRAG